MMGFRIPPEAKKRLEEIAQDQHRPLANLVRAVVLCWLDKFEKDPHEATRCLMGKINDD
jgi:predicted DNA-binding protein